MNTTNNYENLWVCSACFCKQFGITSFMTFLNFKSLVSGLKRGERASSDLQPTIISDIDKF